jgi:hypothetical protein
MRAHAWRSTFLQHSKFFVTLCSVAISTKGLTREVQLNELAEQLKDRAEEPSCQG